MSHEPTPTRPRIPLVVLGVNAFADHHEPPALMDEFDESLLDALNAGAEQSLAAYKASRKHRRVRIITGPHADATGTLTLTTRNGWNSVKLDATGETVKVRGARSLVDADAHRMATAALNTTSDLPKQTPMTQVEMYTTKVTRAAAYRLRRDCLVARIREAQPPLPQVRQDQFRVVIASGDKSKLVYEPLGCPGNKYTLDPTELKQLLSESDHFQRLWKLVTHRDYEVVHGKTQCTPHVIYAALMTGGESIAVEAVHEGQRLVHVSNDQIYVGLASGGIRHRWLFYTHNHFDAANCIERSRGKVMLSDAYVRMHCAQGGIVWLWVVQNNPDLPLRAEEKRMIEMLRSHGVSGLNGTT